MPTSAEVARAIREAQERAEGTDEQLSEAEGEAVTQAAKEASGATETNTDDTGSISNVTVGGTDEQRQQSQAPERVEEHLEQQGVETSDLSGFESDTPQSGAPAGQPEVSESEAEQIRRQTRDAEVRSQATRATLQRRQEQIRQTQNQAPTDAVETAVRGFEIATGTDVPGEGPITGEQTRARTEVDPQERFGAFEAAEGFEETVTETANTVRDVGGDVGQLLARRVTPGGRVLQGDIRGLSSESGPAARFGRGVGEAPGGIVGSATIATEAPEFVAEGAEAVGEGRGGQFIQQATQAGVNRAVMGAGSAIQNPAQTVGQVVGGVAISGGIGAAAGRAGSLSLRGEFDPRVTRLGDFRGAGQRAVERGRRFAQAERGQVGLSGGGRLRGETDAELDDPEPAVDMDALGESLRRMEEQARRERIQRGEVASRGPSISQRRRAQMRETQERETRPTTDVDIEQPGITRDLQRRAEQPQARVGDGGDVGPAAPFATAFAATDTGAQQLTEQAQETEVTPVEITEPFAPVDVDQPTDVFTPIGTDQPTDVDQPVDVFTETDTDQAVDADTTPDPDRERDRDRDFLRARERDRDRDRELELGGENAFSLPDFGQAAETYTFDFANPLSGGALRTNPDTGR